MNERNKATIRATKDEGIFDLMIVSNGGRNRIDKPGLTATEVCDCLFSGPLVDFLEFGLDGKPVNHEAIHAEAKRRGKSIINQGPCPGCGRTTSADPSCAVCGVPWPSA